MMVSEKISQSFYESNRCFDFIILKLLHSFVRQGYSIQTAVTKYHCSTQSKFQFVEIIDTHAFGKCLVLDGHMQSSVNDEFVYHESLVHIAMLSHPQPRLVFIGGGGEGATLREVLRHKTVEKCTMVKNQNISSFSLVLFQKKKKVAL